MTQPRSRAALTAVFAVLAICTLSAAETKTESKIKLVIIDGQNNHDWRATTPFMRKILQESGRFTVDVATTPQPNGKGPAVRDAVRFPPDLTRYNVVLSNYNGQPWPVAFQKALEDYVKSGKGGLVIVHAANNSFPNWREYNRMIGMGWRDNRFGARLTLDANGKEVRVPKGKGPGAGHGPRHPFQIIMYDTKHPITRGMPKTWMHASDELYHGMRGPIEHVHLLATALSDQTHEHEPMIWTVAYGKGRVFHTPMGHDVQAMRCIGFIATLERGTEWAATGKVTLPLPASFPTADKSSSVTQP